MLEITHIDIDRIGRIASDVGLTLVTNEILYRDGILWLQVDGPQGRAGYDKGREFLHRLLEAGINQFVDEDFTTKENNVTWGHRATRGYIWIDVVDDEPLWRAGTTKRL